MANQKRTRNLVLAFGTLILSTLGGIICYAKVHEAAQIGDIPLPQIPTGIMHFEIVSNDKCIGFLHYSLNRGSDSLTVESKGVLRTKIFNQHSTISLSLEAYFNRVGQLGGSLIRVSSGAKRLSAGTSGINPMNIKLRASFGQAETLREFVIPGPVSITERSGGNYQVKYPFLESIDGAYETILDQPFLVSLGLALRETESDSCSSETEFLDLSAAVKAIQSLDAAIPNISLDGLL